LYQYIFDQILTHTSITHDKANPAERQEQKIADPINGKPNYRRWRQKSHAS